MRLRGRGKKEKNQETKVYLVRKPSFSYLSEGAGMVRRRVKVQISMGLWYGAYRAYAYAPGRRTKNGVGLVILW